MMLFGFCPLASVRRVASVCSRVAGEGGSGGAGAGSDCGGGGVGGAGVRGAAGPAAEAAPGPPKNRDRAQARPALPAAGPPHPSAVPTSRGGQGTLTLKSAWRSCVIVFLNWTVLPIIRNRAGLLLATWTGEACLMSVTERDFFSPQLARLTVCCLPCLHHLLDLMKVSYWRPVSCLVILSFPLILPKL
jgi:hypothetical protein